MTMPRRVASSEPASSPRPRPERQPAAIAPEFGALRLPLYLVSSEPLVISAWETAAGGSLIVHSKRAAVRRYPIACLSRVVSSLQHDWSERPSAIACVRPSLLSSLIAPADRPVGCCLTLRSLRVSALSCRNFSLCPVGTPTTPIGSVPSAIAPSTPGVPPTVPSTPQAPTPNANNCAAAMSIS